MSKYNPTPEQKAKTEARRAAFRQLCQRISEMSEEERAAFAAKMPAIATTDGRALSGHNSLLVAHQHEGATIVGGFQQWRHQGRKVKKGESGIAIWIPKNSGEDSGDTNGFFMGYVFDISQTETIEANNETQAG